MFGKPGRPPEDRLLRQREIYEAVIPVMQAGGVRELTMRQAAQAACPSVGGLYHYFPSKRDLVLHGLNPAALERRCADFWARSRHLEAGQPAQFLEALVEAFVDKVAFVRPSVQAALELGADSLWAGFEPCIDVGIARLAEALARVAPLAARQDPQLFRRAVRRVFFAALVDPSTRPEEVRAELYVLVTGRPLVLQPLRDLCLAPTMATG
jgi:AcrR family transcriptional regulator